MKRPKIKKIVRKKIKSGKQLVKRSNNDTGNKDYAEMLFNPVEKTLDSETLIFCKYIKFHKVHSPAL